MRRGTCIKSIQQVPKLVLGFCCRQPNDVKHLLLNVSPVDSQTASCVHMCYLLVSAAQSPDNTKHLFLNVLSGNSHTASCLRTCSLSVSAADIQQCQTPSAESLVRKVPDCLVYTHAACQVSRPQILVNPCCNQCKTRLQHDRRFNQQPCHTSGHNKMMSSILTAR